MSYLISRYKIAVFVFSISVFFIIFSNNASALTCAVRAGACNLGETPLLKMQVTDNSHAEFLTETNYNNYICCSEAGVTIGTACTGGSDSDIFLKLHSATNSHVEKNTSANYSNDACVSVDIGSIVCGYSTNCSTFGGGGYTCLGEISGNTNAHIGDCGSAYTEKVCCKYSVAAPFCGDGVCNGAETCATCPGDCGVCCVPTSCLGGCADVGQSRGCGLFCPNNNGNPCNDGNACTSGDVCSGGSCSGTPIICDDGDACTTDSCNIGLGCVYSVIPPTCALTAAPSSINIGDSSTLSWTTTCADTASIDKGVGNVVPVAAGSKIVLPTNNTPYIMTAANTGGTCACQTTIHICGDGIVSGPEFCDTLGNINCDGSRPVCNSDCSDCTCLFADDLVWAGNFLGVRQPIMCIIIDLILWILSIVGRVSLLVLIFGGVFYVVSGSNPERQEKAKKTIVFALLGLILVLASHAIIVVMNKIFVQ